MNEEEYAAPALAAALARWAAEPDSETEADVYAALAPARLFVPVTATLVAAQPADRAPADRAPADGLRPSQTSLVTLVNGEGAAALPAFTGLAEMTAWRPDVRPVRVGAVQVCQAALAEECAAVVLNVAGANFVVSGTAVRALAEGYLPVAEQIASRQVDTPLVLRVPVHPAGPLVEALATVLADEAAVREAYLIEAAVEDEPFVLTVGLVLSALGNGPAETIEAGQPTGPVGQDVEVAALVNRLAAALGSLLDTGLDLAVLGPTERERTCALVSPVYLAD